MKNNIDIPTSVATWIGLAFLQKENRHTDAFQAKEIFKKIQSLGLQRASDVTLQAHITNHCVANANASPNTHRYLYRISQGWYRLYRPGDSCHQTREKGKITPHTAELPEKYQSLLNWYNNEYCKEKTSSPQRKVVSANIPFTRIEKNAIIIPNTIMEKMDVQNGDYVAFVNGQGNAISLRKARVQVEVS